MASSGKLSVSLFMKQAALGAAFASDLIDLRMGYPQNRSVSLYRLPFGQERPLWSHSPNVPPATTPYFFAHFCSPPRSLTNSVPFRSTKIGLQHLSV